MKERVIYIDVARGIAIIGMLIGHAMHLFDCRNEYIWKFFWSFHMPLFAILAGYFFKNYVFFKHVQNGLRSLILPYYLVSIVSFLTLFAIQVSNGTFDISSTCNYLWRIIYIHPRIEPFGFWFVLALFLARLLFCIIRKVSKNDWPFFLWSILLFIIAFYYLPFEDAYLYFPQAMMFPIYMFIGYLWNKHEVFKHCRTWVLTVSLMILSFAWLFEIDFVHLRFPFGLFNLVTTNAICFSLLYVCKFLSSMKSTYLKVIVESLAYCGRHSLMILSFHSYIIFTQFWKKINVDSPIMLLFMFICGTIMATIFFENFLQIINHSVCKNEK